jgi:ADP-heptose:LPS heptosyltransferase
MEKIAGKIIHTNCLFFKGDLPCAPHKEFGYSCENCPSLRPIQKEVLIIKLGAIGDVIRTTPLVRKIREVHEGVKITWLTLTPSILPKKEIDEILLFDFSSVLFLQNKSFHTVINLDKDKEACALATNLKAQEKYGFVLKNGFPSPVNPLAEHKFLTGLFDDISKANKKSYVDEIFEIMGWTFNGEEYLFDNHADKGFEWDLPKNGLSIGLNTGCGDRWTTRLWPNEYWEQLILDLQKNGLHPILLGGKQEHDKNKSLAERTNAIYLGHFSLPEFIHLLDQMDLIVTQVTMAMHIAVALRKKMVLMNNIFNPFEFELYGRGEIVAPDTACSCYFSGKCRKGVSCMKDLPPSKVLQSIQNQLSTPL